MTMKELSQLHWLNVEIDRDNLRPAPHPLVGRICPGCPVAAVQGRMWRSRLLKSSS